MDTRKHKTLYSGAGLFVLSNITCVHARFACVGMEGFLVYKNEFRCKVLDPNKERPLIGHRILGDYLLSLKCLTAANQVYLFAGRVLIFRAYQISHRRGVLLHGTPFLFVATPNPSWLGSGRKSKFAGFRRFLGVSLIWLPLFFMSFLPGFYFINKKLVINRYYNVVMSRAMSITRQPAPNAYR